MIEDNLPMIATAVAVVVYFTVAGLSFGPYGLVEQVAGYAGAETPDGDYQARHASRTRWLLVSALWPLTLTLAFAGYCGRQLESLAEWLRQEV